MLMEVDEMYSFNPYQQPLYPTGIQNRPQMELIRVTGIDGARAYQMPPNSSTALFDASNDVMYIKTTDGAGFPSIRSFTFTEIAQNATAQNNDDYVKRDEFEQLKNEIKKLSEVKNNGKQPVRQSE